MRGRGIGLVVGMAVIVVGALLGLSVADYLTAPAVPSPGGSLPPPAPTSGCTNNASSYLCAGVDPAHRTGGASGCALRYVQTTDSWVCQAGAKGTPGAEKIGTPTSSSTAALEAANGLGAGPPFPHPFLVPPAKPWLAGQPEPQPRPILLMQVSAGLATAPASPTATVLISDWPAAGTGTVSVSVYRGDTGYACSSPPLRTETAAALPGVPGVSSATFAGLIAGRYEVQASFVGPVGLMSTPCGREALKVVAATGTSQK